MRSLVSEEVVVRLTAQWNPPSLHGQLEASCERACRWSSSISKLAAPVLDAQTGKHSILEIRTDSVLHAHREEHNCEQIRCVVRCQGCVWTKPRSATRPRPSLGNAIASGEGGISALSPVPPGINYLVCRGIKRCHREYLIDMSRTPAMKVRFCAQSSISAEVDDRPSAKSSEFVMSWAETR